LEHGRQIIPVPSPAGKTVARAIPALTHDQIAERAKRLWQQRGCPQGQDEYIWHEAERQLKRELGME
jgi:hypothetical protein